MYFKYTLFLFGTLLTFLKNTQAAQEIEFPDYKNHPCNRQCNSNHMTCVYHFWIENIYTMELECLNCLTNSPKDCYNKGCIVGDGTQKIVNVYNRMLPGPQIEVCLKDRIRVYLHNLLDDVSTSIHWHGMHQVNTVYMDGVPQVTQCPIIPYTTFTYDFIATEMGTHFYHSHSGLQRAQGAFGHLIVRIPDNKNVHKKLYDFDLSDHVISIAEWQLFKIADQMIKFNRVKDPAIYMSSILITGFGSNVNNSVPPYRFNVVKGFKYRFRMIHAGYMACPVKFTIAKHTMLIISTDGFNVNPVKVDSLIINAGERLDFVIDAKEVEGVYWMNFVESQGCKGAVGIAVLDYSTGKNANKLTAVQEVQSNTTLNCAYNKISKNCIEYDQMTRTYALSKVYNKRKADFTFFIGYDTYQYAEPLNQGINDSNIQTSIISNITFKYPTVPMTIATNPATYCNPDNKDAHCKKGEQFCDCTHVLSVPLGSLVELILVHEGRYFNVTHPMHLHGYGFSVVGMKNFENYTTLQAVKDLNAKKLLKRNLDKPSVEKDTITVPIGGYAVVRFIANNPGFWFFHCHVDIHLQQRMALVFRVGNTKNIPHMPWNFPKCGSFY